MAIYQLERLPNRQQLTSRTLRRCRFFLHSNSNKQVGSGASRYSALATYFSAGKTLGIQIDLERLVSHRYGSHICALQHRQLSAEFMPKHSTQSLDSSTLRAFVHDTGSIAGSRKACRPNVR
jgi:hypothetical protein